MWLSLLTSKWTWIALLIGALSLTIGIQRVALKHKNSVIAEREQTIGEMRASVAERDALIKTQNGYVEAWKAAALKQQELNLEAAARARSLLAANQAKVNQLMQATVPQSCEGSMKWLLDTAPSLVW